MLKELIARWTTKQTIADPKPTIAKRKKRKGFFSAKNVEMVSQQYRDIHATALAKTFQKPVALRKQTGVGTAMDQAIAMDSSVALNGNFSFNDIIPQQQLNYFANQSFIGYQLCALLSQHWLISKCCLTPAKDAVRNGYEITVNDGNTKVPPEVIDAIRETDVAYRVNHNLIQFVQLGRVFGIRVAMFQIDMGGIDETRDFYENPFNIDAVKPGTYRGISQIDPYWMTFQLDDAAAGDPASINFYEPTWWVINSMKIHYTHLVIFKTEEVPDILKTTYFYGGIPVPQKVYTRVYAAERCANEAPMLLLTKRTSVIKLDVAQALAEDPGDCDGPGFAERMTMFADNQNNFGVKTIGEDEEYSQFDITLADVDDVTMMQYHLVAAEANMPIVKLLGTSPKGGMNGAGDHEEANYHEELEGIQAHDLTKLLDRHHELLIVSEIAPKFNIAPFKVSVAWASLDAMTAEEQAELNKIKSETDNNLLNAGAIAPDEIRDRVIKDPDSGYSGLIGEAPDLEDRENPDEGKDIENDY